LILKGGVFAVVAKSVQRYQNKAIRLGNWQIL
jgi:hypothetical protein